jgi:hypothetical protein
LAGESSLADFAKKFNTEARVAKKSSFLRLQTSPINKRIISDGFARIRFAPVRLS